jgi:hypothetical protein
VAGFRLARFTVYIPYGVDELYLGRLPGCQFLTATRVPSNLSRIQLASNIGININTSQITQQDYVVFAETSPI